MLYYVLPSIRKAGGVNEHISVAIKLLIMIITLALPKGRGFHLPLQREKFAEKFWFRAYRQFL
ncbi:hypothetical protein Psfp_01123 [Pelotomaculum sp. FP]|nr:hypothetical protein Psfp_01123 [Pelotomaculum sp. FP]